MRVQKMKGEILTKRPEGMDYESYRTARKEQQSMLKKRLRDGFMVWPSKGPKQSKGTLVGRVPELIFVEG